MKICRTPNQMKTRSAAKKRGTRDDEVFVSATIGEEEREVDDCGQDVFDEVDRHVVPGVFADEVFEKQPGDEAIDAVTPISEDSENETAGQADHRDQRETDHVVVEDHAGEFVCPDEGDGEKGETEQETATGSGRHSIGDGPH